MKICKILPDCGECLVNPSSKDLMQVRADLIYDIKTVEENYFNKNEEE